MDSTEYTVAHLFLIKKDKAAFKEVSKWVLGDERPDEVVLAKCLSSVITHALIEVEHSNSSEESVAKLEGYRIEELSKIEYNLISGATPVVVIIKILERIVLEV